MKKKLKKLLKQYYQVKREYDKTTEDYKYARRSVIFWSKFDNAPKEQQKMYLYSHFKREGPYTWLETRECAKKCNCENFADYSKEDMKNFRKGAIEDCTRCKHNLKILNNQLQVICEMIDNRIMSKTLMKRYDMLGRYLSRNKNKLGE